MPSHVTCKTECGILSPQLTHVLMEDVFVGKVKGSVLVFLWISALVLLRIWRSTGEHPSFVLLFCAPPSEQLSLFLSKTQAFLLLSF